MHCDELIRVLRETFSDRRLSRGERSALKGVLADVTLSRADRTAVRAAAFEIAGDEIERTEARQAVAWLYDVVKSLDRVEDSHPEAAGSRVFFSPGDGCRDQIRAQLKGARRAIDICVFTITDDSLTEEIHAAARRGVDVRIVTDDDKAHDPGSDVGRLERAGVPVAYDRSGHMHHKFAIFDRTASISGSYNWTRSAARDNSENIVLTHDRSVVSSFEREFERLWARYA